MRDEGSAVKPVPNPSPRKPRRWPSTANLRTPFLASAARRHLAPPFRFVQSFFGPVFDVDLRSCSRQKRTYSLRVLYLGLLTLAVGIAWKSAIETARYNPAGGMLSLGRLAPALLLACGWFQLIGLTLLGPVLTSTALLLERTRRTLPLLLVTPLTAWNIVASKLMSRSIQLLVLSALSLPVLASVQAYGGIETVDVLGTMALGLANGLFAASVGLAVSTHATSPQRATLTSYAVLVGAYLLVPAFAGWAVLFLVTILSVLVVPPSSVISTSVAIAAVSPFASMVALHAEVFNPGAVGVASKVWLWAPNVALLLCGTGVALVVAARRLRQLAESDPTIEQILARTGTNVLDLRPSAAVAAARLRGGRPQPAPASLASEAAEGTDTATARSAPMAGGPAAAPTESPKSRSAGLAYAHAPGATAGSPSSADIGDTVGQATRGTPPLAYAHALIASSMSSRDTSCPVSDDAILWRELNRRRTEQSGWTWVVLGVSAYLLLLVYLPAGFNGQWSSGAFHGAMTTLYLAVVAVATAVLAAPSIATEKDSACWPMLLSTPLTGRQILGSKGRVIVRRVVTFSAILGGHLLLFTLLGYLHPIALVYAILLSAAVVLFLLMVGMWLSIKVKGSTRATVATLFVALLLWGLLPTLTHGFEAITGSGTWFRRASLCINPFYLMYLTASTAAARSQPQMSYAELTLLLMYGSVGYLCAAGALLAYLVTRFNRLVGRTS